MSLLGSKCGLKVARVSQLPGARISSPGDVIGKRFSQVYLLQALRQNSLTGALLSGQSHELEDRGKSGRAVVALAYRWNDDEIAEEALGVSFEEGVKLFNSGEYYRCHDVFESLWNNALDPQRSILHGIIQCAVGLYHLLHQNHRGAMVELGEGVSKLRRDGAGFGPLHDFEQEASAVLNFVYSTQLEYAACSDDMCITMDGSEQTYRLLGNFGSGEILYRLAKESDGFYIEFLSQQKSAAEMGFESPARPKVKVPILQVSEEYLYGM